MGICNSKSKPIRNYNPKEQPLTSALKQKDQQSIVIQQKSITVKFQENPSSQKIQTPIKPSSKNQTHTPTQRLSPKEQVNEVTIPIRKISSAHIGNTQTVVIQNQESDQKIKDKLMTSSQLAVPLRQSTRSGSNKVQSPASRKYSIVKTFNTDNKIGPTLMQHNNTGQMVIVDIIKMESRSQQYIDKLEESQLDHTHISKVIDIHIDKQHKTFQVVQEYCIGGQFSQLCESQKLTEQQVGRLLQQMIDAIAYLHSKGLSHDELTIDSFSLFNNDINVPFVKLTDIRSVYQFMYSKNSLKYEPPESQYNKQIEKEEKVEKENIKQITQLPNIEMKIRSPSNDIWALGIIAIELLTQQLPYKTCSLHFNPIEYLNSNPSSLNSLLFKMLELNPIDRLSLQQCLNHPFIIKMKTIQSDDFIQPLINMIDSQKLSYFHRIIFQFLLEIYAGDQVQILKKLFRDADTDKNEILTKNELKSFFPTEEEQQIINELQIPDDLNFIDFMVLASNKKIILTQNCLESSFKQFAKHQDCLTPKMICKVIQDSDENQLEQDFKTYNLENQLYFHEYQQFLCDYRSPKPLE